MVDMTSLTGQTGNLPRPQTTLGGQSSSAGQAARQRDEDPEIKPASESDKAVLGDDFDAFLSLLTTQLQNQDPMSPMDTNQFTEQLVQFSQVEQAIKSNDNLETLIDLQRGTDINTAAALTGKMVEVDGNKNRLNTAEGPMRYVLDVPEGLSEMQVEMVNAGGQVIHRTEMDPASGRREMAWDGAMIGGGTAPDGNYTVRAIGREGAEGEMTNVPTSVIGPVDGATVEDGEIMLEVGGGRVSIDDLKSFRSAAV
ncbi:flagellar hook assembly protein FlgD [Fodinicurvata sp. EGI_FJ10296]|uniref:flagellar hook assembly protein FlgD n=1 Tax=Fodinicurvata sp. EGI_FJ10296 TaxID=3231908 RepID=UPI003456441D